MIQIICSECGEGSLGQLTEGYARCTVCRTIVSIHEDVERYMDEGETLVWTSTRTLAYVSLEMSA